MKFRSAVQDIVDIRPGERRAFAFSTLGAFLVMSFMIAARSLRDAFFLDEFSVEQIPYMTALVAALGVPAVRAFTRMVARRDPDIAYQRMLLILAAGIIALQAAAWEGSGMLVLGATIGFYVWTALGSLLMASGFWILAAEHFELRDAKRLFGPISAGGTLGAMITGLAMRPIAAAVGNGGLVAILWFMPLMLWAQQRAMRGPGAPKERTVCREESLPRVRDSVAELARSPHLRRIAAVVAVASMASYLVDYQFKAAAAAAYTTDEALAGFFGSFYGLTGVAALVLQVLVSAPLLARAGVGWSLAVLPIALILGSTAYLLVPGLAAVVLLRGADNTLRKSLHRTVVEYLYVPVPTAMRRRTRALIDSIADSAAEGAAALVVIVAIGLAVPTLLLSLLAIGLAAVLLGLSWGMDKRYVTTLAERMHGRVEEPDDDAATTSIVGGEVTLPTAQFDLGAVLDSTGMASLPERLGAADPAPADAALDEARAGRDEGFPGLVRLLARDSRRAAELLRRAGPAMVPAACAVLLDENGDFVIRRRLPPVLAGVAGLDVDDALLRGLSARRFEVRYRCGVALARRQRDGVPAARNAGAMIWAAVRLELGHERPIWELQRLLDDRPGNDDFIIDRLAGRGELSLEHTFRLLSLVLDASPVRMAFQGIVGKDASLRQLSLEYLDQVLPPDVRDRLWPFIGDLSEHRRRQTLRPMNEVVDDLLRTGVTLFGDASERARLRAALAEACDED